MDLEKDKSFADSFGLANNSLKSVNKVRLLCSRILCFVSPSKNIIEEEHGWHSFTKEMKFLTTTLYFLISAAFLNIFLQAL